MWMKEVAATVQNGVRSQLHALCYNLFCVFSPSIYTCMSFVSLPLWTCFALYRAALTH
ncbi:hypothetical protein K523DRAFT_322286, partial [Schizophyllum commune Tattone D]